MSVALPQPIAHGTAARAELPAQPAALVRREVWPDTSRLLPWMLAGFLAMLWLVPFDAVTLPLPLPVDSTLDRFVLPVVAVVWLGAVASRWVPVRPRWRPTAIDPALIAFLAIALLSVLVNVHTLAVIGEFDLAVKKFALLFSFAALFYIVSTTIRASELHAFSTLFVVLAAVCAAGVIYEYRTGTNVFYNWTRDLLPGSISVGSPPADPKFGRESVSGPTAHAIAMATLFGSGISFALTGYMESRDRRARTLHALATMLILAGCFGTIRKTGALAPAAALTTVLLYRPKGMLRMLPLGAAMIVAIQVITPGAISRVKAQFANGFFTNTSVLGRTDDYGPTTPDITDKLALGRGHGTFDPERYRFLDNEYLGRLVETGVLGTAAYILLILAVLVVGHRATRSSDPIRQRIGVATVATAAVYAVTGVVFDALSFSHAPYMLLFTAGLAVVAATSAEPTAPSQVVPTRRRQERMQAGARETAAAADGAPDLSVIVVTHNGRDQALKAIESAHASCGAATVEWFVVDSGSQDGTPDAIARRWPEVNLRRRANIGFAAANNVGLREASGRYVLLMNPDVEILEGTLADLVQLLDERPGVGAASVLQRSLGGGLLPSIGRFPTGARQLGEALRLHRLPGLGGLQEMDTSRHTYAQERSVDWVVGAFLVVRREAFQEVGELDERFFLYSEEKDWCYRIRDAGWDVRHLPNLAVLHLTGGYGNPQLKAQLTYSKVLFAEKHLGRFRSKSVRAGLVLRHAVRVGRLSLLPPHRDPGRSRLNGERTALAVARGRAVPRLVPDTSQETRT